MDSVELAKRTELVDQSSICGLGVGEVREI